MSKPTSPTRLEKVYQYILQYKSEHDGNSPSIREIMSACRIPSSSVAKYYLDAMEARNLIRRGGDKGKSRRIEVIGGAWTMNL
ncbi:MAG: hypothetical protein DYG86_01300 [Chloroflexi bacterium CFX2]|nr:hypothetical protein [Chloroflexi bacterium CFX2]